MCAHVLCVFGYLSYPLSTPGWATANSVLLLLVTVAVGIRNISGMKPLQLIYSSLQATAHLAHMQEEWTLLTRKNNTRQIYKMKTLTLFDHYKIGLPLVVSIFARC